MSHIVVVGAGYVGLANALLFAQKGYQVTVVERDQSRGLAIREGRSYLSEPLIVDALKKHYKQLSVQDLVTIDFSQVAMTLICVPTNFDEEKGSFDTGILDAVLDDIIPLSTRSPIVIKSTIPIGYTQAKVEEYKAASLLYSPEFLREGSALWDSMYPTRLIVGGDTYFAKRVAELYQNAITSQDVPTLLMDNTQAEMVKLFSNAYLAMRVAFFNELDSFAKMHQLDAKPIIKGMGYDPRIGRHYNNPSFGYGGYCLPKDTNQLKSQTQQMDLKVIQAITQSNQQRKAFIVEDVLAQNARIIGVYSLQMKQGSDNIRESAILDIIAALQEAGKTLYVYDDRLNDVQLNSLGLQRMHDLDDFKKVCDIILANRWDESLKDVTEKVYTRDVFGDC